MGRAPASLVLALFAAGSSTAEVVEIWTRRSIQFVNLGRAELSATATGLATLNASSDSSSHLATLNASSDSSSHLATLNASSDSSSHLSTLTLPFDAELAITATVLVTDPDALPITAVAPSIRQRPDLQGGGVIGNVSGAIASSAGGLTPNTLPATGGYTLCALIAPFPPCFAQLNLAVGATSAGGAFIGSGVGGVFTVGGTGDVLLSVVGAPYTVKTVSVANRTANSGFDVFVEQGFAHGPASVTSSTALTSGVLQLVTANQVTIVGPGDADRNGNISRTLIHVIPEPALFPLFGAGAVAVARLGRLRGRR